MAVYSRFVRMRKVPWWPGLSCQRTRGQGNAGRPRLRGRGKRSRGERGGKRRSRPRGGQQLLRHLS